MKFAHIAAIGAGFLLLRKKTTASLSPAEVNRQVLESDDAQRIYEAAGTSYDVEFALREAANAKEAFAMLGAPATGPDPVTYIRPGVQEFSNTYVLDGLTIDEAWRNLIAGKTGTNNAILYGYANATGKSLSLIEDELNAIRARYNWAPLDFI